MNPRQIRQGDVLLIAVREPAFDRLVRATDAEGRPLAGVRVEGEATGHAHQLAGRLYELLRKPRRADRSGRTSRAYIAGQSRVIFLERPTPLTHPEHREVEVPAGWWELRLQREWVPRARRAARRWD